MNRALRTGAAALVTITAAVGASVGGYALTAVAGDQAPRPAPSATSAAPAPVQAAGVTPSPLATGRATALSPAAVSRALGPALRSAALGEVHARIVSLPTGRALLDRGSTTPVAPASTAKLLTAAAILSVDEPDTRFTTTVRSGRGGDLVLVGGGDPTLTAAPAGQPAPYAGAARLADLAAAVHRAGVLPKRIVVDGSLFAGAAVSPYWAAEDVPSDYAGAITAVMIDGGRATPHAVLRSAAPDLAAGRALAAALGLPRLTVVRGRAPVGARVLGAVHSAALSVLVEQMLHLSDNVIAECLGRQVALTDRQPATFTGAAAAIRAAVRHATGADAGPGMADASGLADRDRLSMATLVNVLRAAADRPGLRGVLTGLPTGGWSGTLTDRYRTGVTRGGAGVVRAKTGTLTGVSTLAGLVHTRGGAVAVFAVAAERVGNTESAQAALDALLARLAACGC